MSRLSSVMTPALVAALLLIPGSMAGVISPRLNTNENVLLADCMDSNNQYSHSEYAYFSGNPNGSPSATAPVDNGQSWELSDGSKNSGRFPDQNVFSSQIRFQPDDGTYAGLGQSNQGFFDCYRHDHNSAYFYTNPAGLTCVEQYICNHVAPQTDPVFTHFAPSTDAATLETLQHQSASSILGLAKNTFSNGECTPGNSQAISDNGCSISFSCSANSNAELGAMVDFLTGNVAETTAFATYRQVNNGPSPPCQSPIGCPPPPAQNLYYVTIPMQLAMNVNYLETPQFPQGLEAASFSYSISCPASSCFACQFLESVLSAGALVPDLDLIAGVANVGVTAACQRAANC